ncbi:penicillin-binding transpeptidase domain-containing protein [Amphritea sp. 2_MG-2023]|uniref:peptidoglycan D,D-transpeptidase FtsI family protein n=1 Tax=Amphritea TaxID=515417 RepID=UPI001C0657FB|nr:MULTISPECIES: penicillin-binding transpeptidase domain-containing protein [Amphritea]MBU2965195.1 penicillin-binding protein 2 [Amphritea atlantica]MDO6419736.1 penicillin-binding transpeptidase domain-containing protein [Amphritea sp. 2_MG-2023]
MSDEQGLQARAARGWRLWLVFALLCLIAAGVAGKMLSLNVQEQDFLKRQGDARVLRTAIIPAHRGMISDRNGLPLSVSAPVSTVWMNPKEFDLQSASITKLASLIDTDKNTLLKRVSRFRDKQFIYLKRQMTPAQAEQVEELHIPGIYVDREYKRFYPAAEVATHLVGFTGLDGVGQEGIELAFEDWLQGIPGKKLVMRDLLGRTVKHIRELEPMVQGKDLQLSIDLRLQYLAYRELKAAVQAHKADSAAMVVLDVHTGEVLAMVNQPSYNPNDRSNLGSGMESLRNRAVTDTFEPGSTMKPLTIAAALMSGKYTLDSKIDTSPGYIRVKGKTIRDHRNYGVLSMGRIITKSSNVGATKLALSLHGDAVRNVFHNVGLGQVPGTGFPGEQAGVLPYLAEKRLVERATMSYGYGLSVTPLQLAQAYLPFATGGLVRHVSLLKLDRPESGTRVMPKKVADAILRMMETVTQSGGTGRRAAIEGYRVAGKTGTVHKVGVNGYADDQYMSIFAGVAPVDNPAIVAVVMVDNPKGQEYYGGEVAAPLFSRVVGGALRMLNVAPDNWQPATSHVVMK